jgi:multiple sugar transport system substrate-binding protein
MSDGPFADDPFDDDSRSSRDSHTARLAYVRVEPEKTASRIVPWAMRSVGALVLVAAIVWFALPAPMERQFPGRVLVRLWHQWTGQRQPLIDAIVASFNKSQERYEVIALAVPGAISDQKLMLAIAGGEPPDVMTQWSPTVGTWAGDGLLQPLENRLTAEEHRILRTDAFPVVNKAAWCHGHLYGISIGLNNFACYYRPDLVRAAGLDPDHFPDSLEELVEWGHKLDRVDAQGRLERVGFLPSRLALFAPLFGGGFTERADGGITIDTEGNRRALTFISDVYRHYGYERMIQFRSSLNSGSLAVEWPFVSGLYPISVDGQWRVEQLATYAPEVPYRTAPLPPPKGGRVHAGFGTVNLAIIPVGAREPDGALAFMRYWSGLQDADVAGAFNASGGWLPPLRTTVQSPDFQAFLTRNPQFRTFITAIDSPDVEPVPPVAYQVYFNSRIWQAEDRVVRGDKTPEQALRDLEAEVERERGRRSRLVRQ